MDQSVAPTLTAALRSYLEAKRLDGYSPRTLYSYRRQLQHLASVLGKDTPVDYIRLEHLRAYLSSFTHLKTSSLANRVRVVKVFCKWLYEEETLLRKPAVKLKEPRLPHRIPKALSIEEVELLRDACKNLLEHALVEFFFATGCRVGEIHALDQDKVDWTRRSTIVLGKGNKEREVYFGAKAALWLRRYLDSRGNSSPALFVTDRRRAQKNGNLSHQRMSISQMQRIFKRVAIRCDLATRVTPQVLRSGNSAPKPGHAHRGGAVDPGARLTDYHAALRPPIGRVTADALQAALSAVNLQRRSEE